MEDADFFIFADVEKLDASITEPTEEQWNSVRGAGELVFQIAFPGDVAIFSEKQVFDQDIQRILSLGRPVTQENCMRAMHMIRGALIRLGSWNEDILTYLCMQLRGEWGVFKVPETLYNVDEVNAWSVRGALPWM